MQNSKKITKKKNLYLLMHSTGSQTDKLMYKTGCSYSIGIFNENFSCLSSIEAEKITFLAQCCEKTDGQTKRIVEYHRFFKKFKTFEKIKNFLILVLPLPIYMNTQLMSGGARSSPTSQQLISGGARSSPTSTQLISGVARSSPSTIETTYARYSAPNTPRDKSFSNTGKQMLMFLSVLGRRA